MVRRKPICYRPGKLAQGVSTMRQLILAGILSAASTGLVASELMIYPNEGQDDVQQEQDNFQCYSWAKGESGFDPMAPPTRVWKTSDLVLAKIIDLSATSSCCKSLSACNK